MWKLYIPWQFALIIGIVCGMGCLRTVSLWFLFLSQVCSTLVISRSFPTSPDVYTHTAANPPFLCLRAKEIRFRNLRKYVHEKNKILNNDRCS